MKGIALITGASSGIGAALAVELAGEYQELILVARRKERLEEVQQCIVDAAPGCRVILLVADVADFENYQTQLRELLESRELEHPLELAVLNAGVAKYAPITKPLLPTFKYIMDINLLGAVATIDVILPLFLSRGKGKIVGVSSMAAYRGLPSASAYSASKAALWKLMESLRTDLTRTSITVTSIHPGYVRTEITGGNRFPMPFILSSEKAARLMARAIRKRKAHYDFPFAYRWLFYGLRLIPEGLFHRIFRYIKRKSE